jgi:hypothetical protein
MTYQYISDISQAICETWCWNMNPNICTKNQKITQFCRFLYTMVRIWVWLQLNSCKVPIHAPDLHTIHSPDPCFATPSFHLSGSLRNVYPYTLSHRPYHQPLGFNQFNEEMSGFCWFFLFELSDSLCLTVVRYITLPPPFEASHFPRRPSRDDPKMELR